MGVSAADGGLLALHLIPDAEEPVHLLLEFRMLFAGDLGLVLEFGPAAPLHIGHRAGGLPWPGGRSSAAEPQVDDDVGGVPDQGFRHGRRRARSRPGPEKILQKLEGLQIQVVGGLVQQQKVRLLPQEPGQLELHPLTAGQPPQGAVPAGQVRWEAQRPQKGGFLWRGELNPGSKKVRTASPRA